MTNKFKFWDDGTEVSTEDLNGIATFLKNGSNKETINLTADYDTVTGLANGSKVNFLGSFTHNSNGTISVSANAEFVLEIYPNVYPFFRWDNLNIVLSTGTNYNLKITNENNVTLLDTNSTTAVKDFDLKALSAGLEKLQFRFKPSSNIVIGSVGLSYDLLSSVVFSSLSSSITNLTPSFVSVNVNLVANTNVSQTITFPFNVNLWKLYFTSWGYTGEVSIKPVSQPTLNQVQVYVYGTVTGVISIGAMCFR